MSYVLVRSGETDFDVEARVQGTIDLPLTIQGRTEVDAAAEELRGVPVEVIYCCPGEPAFSTARVIGRALDIPVKPLRELDNMHFGLWQGMPVEEIRRKQPKTFRQWQEEPTSVCPPEGETFADVHSRVVEGLRKPLKKGVPFAIVAPEPLATLISCVLKGEEPRLAGPLERPVRLVEKIEPRPEPEPVPVARGFGLGALRRLSYR
jgi:broad specificity phosphatase PhoE